MSKQIKDALAKLDPANPNHWTDDGLPRMDTIKILSGDPSLTREQVTTAAPAFNREAALAALQGAGTPAATTAPPVTDSPPAAPVQAASGADEAAAPALAPVFGDAGEDGFIPMLNPAPLVMQGPDDQETLKAKIEEVKLYLSDAINQQQEAKNNVEMAQNVLADLEAKLAENGGSPRNAITDYLARQRQNLEERGARKFILKDSGLDLKQLVKDLKSPLDGAMERKTGRGGRRPVRN